MVVAELYYLVSVYRELFYAWVIVNQVPIVSDGTYLILRFIPSLEIIFNNFLLGIIKKNLLNMIFL